MAKIEELQQTGPALLGQGRRREMYVQMLVVFEPEEVAREVAFDCNVALFEVDADGDTRPAHGWLQTEHLAAPWTENTVRIDMTLVQSARDYDPAQVVARVRLSPRPVMTEAWTSAAEALPMPRLDETPAQTRVQR